MPSRISLAFPLRIFFSESKQNTEYILLCCLRLFSAVYKVYCTWLLTVCLQYQYSLASCDFSASLLSRRDKQFLRLAYIHLTGMLSSETAKDLLSRSSALMWNAKWLLSLSQSAVWDRMHYKQTNFLFFLGQILLKATRITGYSRGVLSLSDHWNLR